MSAMMTARALETSLMLLVWVMALWIPTVTVFVAVYCRQLALLGTHQLSVIVLSI